MGVNITSPYSLAALVAAMPDVYYNYGMFESMGWYAMCAEIVTEKQEGNVFMNIYKASELITSDMSAIKTEVCSLTAPRSCLFVGINDGLYIMCAVTMDYEGNYSEMWVSEPFSFALNSQTARDIDELLEKLGHKPAAQAQPAIKMLSL